MFAGQLADSPGVIGSCRYLAEARAGRFQDDRSDIIVVLEDLLQTIPIVGRTEDDVLAISGGMPAGSDPSK